MNFAPLLVPVIHAWVWLVPFAVLIGVLKSMWFKGIVGESAVKFSAWLRLDAREYRRFHNVTLMTADGTTQIDHVFVSRFGIFVVETKNMSGWIFGSEHQTTWTQKIYRNTYRFQNPLRQNYKHVKAIEAALGVAIERIHSVVVFMGGSSFKTTVPPNVTAGGRYITYIKSKREVVFSAGEVETLCEAIQSGRLAPSFSTSRQHVRSLKDRHTETADPTCSACGSRMVKRSVKSGPRKGSAFLGCSAYPRCRSTLALP